MLLTWPSFNNIRLLLMACMPVVIFYMIWLVNTSEDVRYEEGALLDLVSWPDGNAIPVVIAIGSSIAVVIEIYGLYQLFKAGVPKIEHDVTSGLFYYIWALLIMIVLFLAIMFYSGLQSTIIRAKLKGGITKAMLLYVSHLPSKMAIDRLQTRFQCCGRDAYDEWFYIPWYNSGEHGDSEVCQFNKEKERRFVSDSVPYSCCAINMLRPCVHHGVTKVGLIYKYDPKNLTIHREGCEEKLIKEMMAVSWRFIYVMALIILAMIIQVITVRYLHTAYRNGLHIGNQIVSNAYLIRSVSDTASTSGYKPICRVFRNRKLRQSRTMEWIAGGYTRRRILTTSASDTNSSDELLKPIYE